jgi:hypothetical protein
VFAAEDAPVPDVAALLELFDADPVVSQFLWWVRLPTSFPPLFELAFWSVFTWADWRTLDVAPGSCDGSANALAPSASATAAAAPDATRVFTGFFTAVPPGARGTAWVYASGSAN